MAAVLKVWVPLLPPSSNNIYINHPQGKGRILSSQARTFKLKAMRTIQQDGRVAFLNLKQNVPYMLQIIVFFDQIEYKKSEKGKRYKRIDLSNQIKLIEDTVAEATGIGDEHNFRLILEKHCDPDNPGMYVSLTPIGEEEIGLSRKDYDLLSAMVHTRLGSIVHSIVGASDGSRSQKAQLDEPNRASRASQKIRIPGRPPRTG